MHLGKIAHLDLQKKTAAAVYKLSGCASTGLRKSGLPKARNQRADEKKRQWNK